MEKYLYTFGYQTPEQKAHNLDDEDSESWIIVAESKEKALEWGDVLAQKFVELLFNDPSEKWEGYSSGVEEDYEEKYTSEQLKDIEEVQYGESPDMERIVKRNT